MARWRLKGKHYINVEDTTWEYKETLQNGRQKRITLPVPMYLDPDSPGDQNYPGEIIVALKGHKHSPQDYIFSGPPTPDMEPLDEEAEGISAQWASSWQHPIETLEGTYSDAVGDRLAEQLAKAIASQGIAPRGSDEIAELRKLVEQQSAQIAELLASKKPERRV